MSMTIDCISWVFTRRGAILTERSHGFCRTYTFEVWIDPLAFTSGATDYFTSIYRVASIFFTIDSLAPQWGDKSSSRADGIRQTTFTIRIIVYVHVVGIVYSSQKAIGVMT
jgi:hypothetical protein